MYKIIHAPYILISIFLGIFIILNVVARHRVLKYVWLCSIFYFEKNFYLHRIQSTTTL